MFEILYRFFMIITVSGPSICNLWERTVTGKTSDALQEILDERNKINDVLALRTREERLKKRKKLLKQRDEKNNSMKNQDEIVVEDITTSSEESIFVELYNNFKFYRSKFIKKIIKISQSYNMQSYNNNLNSLSANPSPDTNSDFLPKRNDLKNDNNLWDNNFENFDEYLAFNNACIAYHAYHDENNANRNNIDLNEIAYNENDNDYNGINVYNGNNDDDDDDDYNYDYNPDNANNFDNDDADDGYYGDSYYGDEN